MKTLTIILVLLAIVLYGYPFLKRLLGKKDGIGNSLSEWDKITINFEDSISKLGKYIIVDIETTGLPENRNEPPENYENYPRIIQIAWLVLDKDYKEVTSNSYIIKQKKAIPPDSIRIHGITNTRANSEGKEIDFVLSEFQSAINQAEIVIAHNIDFDIPIIESEFIRIGKGRQFNTKILICTMLSSVEFCKLKGSGDRYKYPKLSELYQKCYLPYSKGKLQFKDAHDALTDVLIAAKCFIKLIGLAVIDDSESKIHFDKRTDAEREKEQEQYKIKRREELLKSYKPTKDFQTTFSITDNKIKLRKGDVLNLIFRDKQFYLDDPINLIVYIAISNDRIIGELRYSQCVKLIKAHFNDFKFEVTIIKKELDTIFANIHPNKL